MDLVLKIKHYMLDVINMFLSFCQQFYIYGIIPLTRATSIYPIFLYIYTWAVEVLMRNSWPSDQ